MSNVRDSCDYLVGSTTDPKPYLEWPSEILLDTAILNWKSCALPGTVASRRHELRDSVQDYHDLTICTFQFQPTPSHLLRALSLVITIYLGWQNVTAMWSISRIASSLPPVLSWPHLTSNKKLQSFIESTQSLSRRLYDHIKLERTR